jgi:hypothetical protein
VVSQAIACSLIVSVMTCSVLALCVLDRAVVRCCAVLCTTSQMKLSLETLVDLYLEYARCSCAKHVTVLTKHCACCISVLLQPT